MVVPLVSKLATKQTKCWCPVDAESICVTIKHGMVWYWLDCRYGKPGLTGFVCLLSLGLNVIWYAVIGWNCVVESLVTMSLAVLKDPGLGGLFPADRPGRWVR